MTPTVTVDIAGARIGGAARYAAELQSYLTRSGRQDVNIIGTSRRVDPAWLIQRELANPRRGRRVALNNVSFIAPGSERWTLLGNALHFLTENEANRLDASLRAPVARRAAVVRLSARRSDVLVAPCSTMAERITSVLPEVDSRLVVRHHPVSADSVPLMSRDQAILCPILFAPYKNMAKRLSELMAALPEHATSSLRVRVTAQSTQLQAPLATDRRIDFLGELDLAHLRGVWARSQAIYFPTGLESFGYPLAEARTSGHPVIARATAQNREIAGPALCGFAPGNPESLRAAVAQALVKQVAPDPTPFDPDIYFHWMIGHQQ